MGHELEDYCKENAEDPDQEPISGEKVVSVQGTLDYMDADLSTFVWANFVEFNDMVKMIDIYGESLDGERHRQQWELPEACSYALQSGDVIETVNSQTEIKVIQGELQTALSVSREVARAREFNAYDRKIIAKPRRILRKFPRNCDGIRRMKIRGEYLSA